MKPILKISNRCINCDNCKLICPENAIFCLEETYHIDPWACSLCMACKEICPTDAIRLEAQEENN